MAVNGMLLDYGIYAVVGGIGGLCAELVKCGYIELPRIIDRRLYVGSLAGMVFGSIAGLIGDNSMLNAFVWGIGGVGIVTGLVRRLEGQEEQKCK